MPKNRNDFHSIPNPSTSRLRLIKILVLAGGLSALAGIARAATLQTIYTFPASGASGCYPNGTLLRDATDALYGATGGCPISQINTVFKLTPPLPGQTQWKASVLHSFSGGFDGLTPNADLVKDANGALYGTAMDAGAGLQGVVFQLKPPAPGQTSWTENVLHAFNYNVAYGIGDGAFPGAGVILDDQGALYGTTLYGGSMSDPRWVGFGAVFQLKPPAAGQSTWQHTVLYRFRGGADGESPFAGLTRDATGALYGTTHGGGIASCPRFDGSFTGCGTVFKLTPPAPGQTRWTKTILHRFRNGLHGGYPIGKLLLDGTGAIYGTTYQGGNGPCNDGFDHVIGCGTVFKLTPPAPGQMTWTETVLYHFKGIPDGMGPRGGVIPDGAGNLYGTTLAGGTGNCPDLVYRVVGCGVLFKLAPPAPGQTRWTKSVVYSFKGESDGWKPLGEIVRDAKGNLIGVASLGTSSNFGAVFAIKP